MIGLAIALTALAALATTAALTLAFLSRRDSRELLAARDMLDAERVQLRTVRGELDVETAAHVVTRAQLKVEQDLRSVVEARLNLAQRRVTELLRANLKRATDEEVRAATAAAFAGFDGVPLSETPDGRLLRPGEDA